MIISDSLSFLFHFLSYGALTEFLADKSKKGDTDGERGQ